MKSIVGGMLLGFCLETCGAVAQPTTEHPADSGGARPSITIDGEPDRHFDSLQSALDAATPGAAIRLGEGRFDERVTIIKPVSLIGAGADKTILGPTLARQAALRAAAEELALAIDDASRAVEQTSPRREFTPKEIEDLTKKYDLMKRLFDEYLRPVVLIDGAERVELRSLRVTMPDTPRHGEGLKSCGAVTIKAGGVRLDDCAIVGCLSSGVVAEGQARVAFHNCLVAACWGAGMYGAGAECEIVDCDIRNNYHYNIWIGAERCIIRDSRISGTAWSGLRCGGAHVVIERNAIFENRGAIYAAGANGVVKHNLIYINGGGASCWRDDHSTYESNVFWNSGQTAIYVHGPSEPTIHRNLIVGGESATCYGPQGATRGDSPPAKEYHFTENVLWLVATPMVRVESKDAPEPQPKAMDELDGNRTADPQIRFDDEQKLVLGNTEVVEGLHLEPLVGLTLASRWPLTEEERAIIPNDGTRDSPKWKMLPKRIVP